METNTVDELEHNLRSVRAAGLPFVQVRPDTFENLLAIAHCASLMEPKVREARATLAKLPKTADGVPIVPAMTAFTVDDSESGVREVVIEAIYRDQMAVHVGLPDAEGDDLWDEAPDGLWASRDRVVAAIADAS